MATIARIFYSLVCVFLFNTALFAQNQGILAAEMFIGTDPGQGNAIPLSVADGNWGGAIEQVLKNNQTISSSTGLYKVGVRVKDANNLWGNPFFTIINVQNLVSTSTALNVVQAEYFWDTDPGQGSGTAMLAFDGNFDQAIEQVVKSGANAPALGLHLFHVRIKGQDGTWGTTFKTVVNVENVASTATALRVNQAEYFWDTDPGQGNGTAMLAFDGNFDQAIEQVVKSGANAPALGLHLFQVRIKGQDGAWGTIFKVVVNVENVASTATALRVNQAEYFWDTDPGQGNGTAMLAFDGNFDQAIEQVVKSGANAPALGLHLFHVRIKGQDGTWGTTFKTVVNVENVASTATALRVNQAEYFWDTDPGQGNGTAMLAFDGNFDQAIETASTSYSFYTLSLGLHLFNVRMKGQDGVWGAVFKTVVSVDTCVGAPLSNLTAQGNTTFCAGGSVVLQANAGSGLTYQWVKDGQIIASAQSVTYTATQSGVYQVLVNNGGSCPPNPSPLITVTVSTAPVAPGTISGNTLVCQGQSQTYSISPVAGATSYSWTIPAGWSGSSNTSTLTVTPNGTSGNISVIANNTCGSSPSSVLAITTNTALTPSVSIAASATSICAGTSVTFTATPTNGGSTPAYQWKVNGTNVGTNAATYTSSTLVNNDIVTCVLSSNATCLTSTTATSNAVTMTVNATLTPSVSIAASATSVCSGTSVTFTATPTNGGSTPAYQWKKNGVNVGTNSATYTSSALANNDVVTCVLTSNATCLTSTTATSNSVTMTVNATLTPSVSIAASATSVCTGTSVTFTATPTNGGSTPAYQWKVNGVNVGTNSATYTSSTLANNDVITCVLTSNATCLTSTTATSNAVTMTVNATLTPSVSIAASATSVCSGTNVTFTATPTNGGSTPAYQWKVNGANVGTNSATYTSSTLANGDIVTCVLTSNATCLTSSTVISNAVTMTVNATLTPSVSIAASATSVCAGTSVTFTATPTNGGSTPAYQWKLNGVNVGTNAATYTSSALANNDVVTCVLTSNATCLTSTTATSNSVTMTVNATLTPSVSIAASATSVCAGTSVTFTATPTNGGSTPAYQWKKNGVNVGTNAATYTSSTLANGDAVTCVLTSNATCLTSSTATSNPVTMTVNALPATPTITQNGSTLASSASTGNQWYAGANLISGATGSTYSPTASGVYSVCVSSAAGCTTCSASFNYIATGIEEENISFTLYPNPVSETLYLEFANEGQRFSYYVLNDLGQILSQGSSDTEITSISTQNWTPGVYFLQIETQGKRYTQKVVKQ